MKDKIIVIGSGGHARIIIDIIEEVGKYEIDGIVTNDIFPNNMFDGYEILGNDEILDDLYKKGYYELAMGIGGFRDNKLRSAIFNKCKKIGFEFVTLIHPAAVISRTAKLGEGCVLFAGVIINPNTIINDNVVLATSATVDHDTVIKSHVLVSAGVTVGANDVIEEGVLLALGSKVISGVRIGKNILVGAGAVVVKDLEEPGIYLGIPAQKVR